MADRDTTEQGYIDLVTTLGETGFIILPKRPTAKMINAVTLWDYANGEGATGDDVAEIYGEMGQSRSPGIVVGGDFVLSTSHAAGRNVEYSAQGPSPAARGGPRDKADRNLGLSSATSATWGNSGIVPYEGTGNQLSRKRMRPS
jgi:hypothetical protein